MNDDDRWEYLRAARSVARREGLSGACNYLRRAGFSVVDSKPIGKVTVCGREMHYVKLQTETGETETVCAEEGVFFVSSVRIWSEQASADKLSEDSVVRCLYCGNHTSCVGQDWKEVSCPSCGHLISELYSAPVVEQGEPANTSPF